jgi:hypothetical protein
VPLFVKSPAWISISPAGRRGQAVCVSEMQTTFIGFFAGFGAVMGGWWVYIQCARKRRGAARKRSVGVGRVYVKRFALESGDMVGSVWVSEELRWWDCDNGEDGNGVFTNSAGWNSVRIHVLGS